MKLKIILFLLTSLIVTSSGLFATQSARIVSSRPGAFIKKGNEIIKVRIAQTINYGDVIETDENCRISILLPDHMLLKISSNTSKTQHLRGVVT